MKNLIDLRERVALVAGAGGGGSGAAAVTLLATAGATIVAVDHTDDLVAEAVASVRDRGGECFGIKANLRDATETREIVGKIERKLGRLDFVVNNAGGTQSSEWGPLETTSEETLRNVFQLNFDYVFRICQDAALLMMKTKMGGAIVNIASVSGLNGAPYHGPYGAAKAAVMSMTCTMAVEWARYGIRVNAVAPGSVSSRRTMLRRDPNAKTRAPIGRLVVPDEIAKAALFLLSDLSSGITGQTLIVDGGASALSPVGDLDYYGRKKADRAHAGQRADDQQENSS